MVIIQYEEMAEAHETSEKETHDSGTETEPTDIRKLPIHSNNYKI